MSAFTSSALAKKKLIREVADTLKELGFVGSFMPKKLFFFLFAYISLLSILFSLDKISLKLSTPPSRRGDSFDANLFSALILSSMGLIKSIDSINTTRQEENSHKIKILKTKILLKTLKNLESQGIHVDGFITHDALLEIFNTALLKTVGASKIQSSRDIRLRQQALIEMFAGQIELKTRPAREALLEAQRKQAKKQKPRLIIKDPVEIEKARKAFLATNERQAQLRAEAEIQAQREAQEKKTQDDFATAHHFIESLKNISNTFNANPIQGNITTVLNDLDRINLISLVPMLATHGILSSNEAKAILAPEKTDPPSRIIYFFNLISEYKTRSRTSITLKDLKEFISDMTAFIVLFKRHLEQETQARNLLIPKIEECIIISPTPRKPNSETTPPKSRRRTSSSSSSSFSLPTEISADRTQRRRKDSSASASSGSFSFSGSDEIKGEELDNLPSSRGVHFSALAIGDMLKRAHDMPAFPEPKIFAHWKISPFPLAKPGISGLSIGEESFSNELSKSADPAETIIQFYKDRLNCALTVAPQLKEEGVASVRNALAHAILLPELASAENAYQINKALPDFSSNPLAWKIYLDQMDPAKIESCPFRKECLKDGFFRRILWLNYFDESHENLGALGILISEIHALGEIIGQELPAADKMRKIRNALWHGGEEISLEAEFGRDLFNPAELLAIKQKLLDHQSDAAVALMHGDSVQRSGEDLGSGWVGTLP
jgi:hypothetical protein